jgi:hypothetical protein
MRTLISCGWCHTENDRNDRSCRSCGHDVGVSRLACQCYQCVDAVIAHETREAYYAFERGEWIDDDGGIRSTKRT